MRASDAPSTQALRGWQRRALVRYLTAKPRISWPSATPARGKTAFALRIVVELLPRAPSRPSPLWVPTEHLKNQWRRLPPGSASRWTRKFSNSNSRTSREYHGVVVTYAQVASHPTRHRVHREPQDAGRSMRSTTAGTPRALGDAIPGGVLTMPPGAGADRDPVPEATTAPSRS